MTSLLGPVFNLSILIGVMVYYLRAPIRDFVHQRHVLIRDELQQVRERLRQAQERYDEFSAKLKAIDAEVSALRAQARQDASSTKVRIVSEAQRLAGTIVTDAKAAAEGMFGELRAQLCSELGQRVIERAEKLMRERLTGDDQARIRKEFSMQLEAAQ